MPKAIVSNKEFTLTFTFNAVLGPLFTTIIVHLTKSPSKTLVALTDLLIFVEQILEKYECSMKLQTAICVAIEEAFVNVARYAYKDGEG